MAEESGLRLDGADVRHLIIAAVATIIIATSMFTPWWTRGYTVEYEDGATPGDEFPVFVDTLTVSYYPFSTPNYGPFQFDSVREAAVTITGIAVAVAGALIVAHNLVRAGVRTGRVAVDPGVPVKLAIAAFLIGAFGVLFALLWPFMGVNGDGIFSADTVEGGGDDVWLVEDRSFLNAGFFLGVVGFMLYPAYLWVDAHLNRAARQEKSAAAPDGQPAF